MEKATLRPRFRLLAVLLLAAPLLLPSCRGEPPVLTLGDVAYSESDLLTFNALRRTRLAELTAFGLAVTRGETGSLGRPLLERRMGEALLEALERELALEFADVSEAALEARYRANPEYELTVRHLVVLAEAWASEAVEAGARARAEAALDRIGAGEPFPQVAGDVSEEPGAAERGGLLQPGREGTWVEEFWRAAQVLEPGQVSPVIRTPYGFHVLKLEGRSPVPYPEARSNVVEEVASLLPSQDQRLRAWADSVSSPVRVDSLALEAVWEAGESLFGMAQLLEADAGGGLARWPGGSLSGPQLRDYLVSLERPEWEHVSQGGLPEVLRVTADAARRAFLSETAASRGVALSPGEMEAVKRDWDTAVASWAQGLGFREGMRLEALRSAALAGVSSSSQGARIARDELHVWGPMLLSAYPIGPRDA